MNDAPKTFEPMSRIPAVLAGQLDAFERRVAIAGAAHHAMAPMGPGMVEVAGDRDPREGVMYLMRRIVQLCALQVDMAFESKNLTSAQLPPLFELFAGRAATVAELARECGRDAGSTTRIMDRLEGKGFCQRQRSKGDRRTVHIELTDRGREVARTIPVTLAGVEAAQLADLSPGEIASLKQLLRRMVDSSKVSTGVRAERT